MESKFVFFVAFFGILPVIDCSRAYLKVNTGLDPKIGPTQNETDGSNKKTGGSSLALNSTKVDKVYTRGDQVDGSKEGPLVENGIDRNNSSKHLASREAEDVQKGEGGASEESKGNRGGEEKEKLRNGVESKNVGKVVSSEGVVISSTSVWNKGSRGEECDSSNMCTDGEKKLVACLRVPGDDSPDLLLLIQNKGKGLLDVTISAPDFVLLAERKVQVQEREYEKVKLSVIDGGTDSLIILTAGSGNCIIDVRNLIAHSSQKAFDASGGGICQAKALSIKSLTWNFQSPVGENQSWTQKMDGKTVGMTLGTMRKHQRHRQCPLLQASQQKAWLHVG
ncbi:hypothetical protein I3843_11G119500 [Carya illinoinensis]|uniref:uncharacterized protein LOC122280879 isoform X3 n=1 Tax=Carya illinoinensis TaxID=32201 RepID=UPI001C7288C4|nr:uncharacterized protein LOC122280879 isoform X3 [Carya illinoinensis]KAG7956342.1 hypothetical protein I3843_11G119500 [Carya illinoinensis]KAG7956343.1 hypothetical protein I3843_11G119500 [Carya illinoinensis]